MEQNNVIEKWTEKHLTILNDYSKGHVNNEIMQLYRDRMNDIQQFISDIEILKIKAEKWDKLGKEISKYYLNKDGEYDEINPENNGHLGSIGEVSATAFGWL